MVHLELHTGDLPGALRVLLPSSVGWRPERIEAGRGSYLALEMGNGLGGGIVECETHRPLWLPYVEVAEICRARRSGLASWVRRVLLEPREGPAGWRSVVVAPAGGEIAFWQSKDPKR